MRKNLLIALAIMLPISATANPNDKYVPSRVEWGALQAELFLLGMIKIPPVISVTARAHKDRVVLVFNSDPDSRLSAAAFMASTKSVVRMILDDNGLRDVPVVIDGR